VDITDDYSWLDIWIQPDLDSTNFPTLYGHFGSQVTIENNSLVFDYAGTQLGIARDDRLALKTGSYFFSLATGAIGGGGTVSGSGTITATFGTGPHVSNRGVRNSATPSIFRNRIAPGEIVSIYGFYLGPSSGVGAELTSDRSFITKELQGVRVLVDGSAAPVLFANNKQINAVIPYAVKTKSTARIEIEVSGKRSAAVEVDVVPADPGIFNHQSGLQAVVLNQDQSINANDNRAARNSVITFFATGGGETDPAGADGRIANTGVRL